MGCGRDFDGVRAMLSEDGVALDVPYDVGGLHEAALWVDTQLQAVADESWTIVGYSMGGRIAIELARVVPERCRHLVLIGAHFGLAPEARAHRLVSDDQLAGRLEADFDEFLDGWYQLPLFRGVSDHLDYDAMIMRRNTHYSPTQYAHMLRRLSVGHQDPITSVACPVTLVSGEWDEKYTTYYKSLGYVHHVAAEASHAVVLQRPDAIAEIIQNLD